MGIPLPYEPWLEEHNAAHGPHHLRHAPPRPREGSGAQRRNRQPGSRVKGFGIRGGGSVAIRTRGAGFYQPTGEAICQRGSVHVKPGRVDEATVRGARYKACGMQDPCHAIVYHNILGRDPKRARHIGGNCPAPIWRGTHYSHIPASQMTFAYGYASLFRGPATRSTTPIRFASRRTQQLTRVPVGGTLTACGDGPTAAMTKRAGHVVTFQIAGRATEGKMSVSFARFRGLSGIAAALRDPVSSKAAT